MRRSIIVAFLLSLLGCSKPAAPPIASKDAAEDIAGKTVALVGEDARLMPHAFCSGVWVGVHEILTARHCLTDDEEELDSKFADHARYASYGDIKQADAKTLTGIFRPLHVIKTEEKTDLALLYADSIPPHATVALSTREIRPGMPVQAEGHPLGLWWTYSTGKVSGHRFIGETDLAVRYVVATAAIGPGSSGGGLFDEDGDLVGICHGHATAAQMINLWIPRDDVQAFLAKR